jgi:predicted lipoprotein with Yx(FWY)xxD motif
MMRANQLLWLGMLVACSKRDSAVDTSSAAGAVVSTPPVAVTTEVAPGVLMTVEGGPGMGLVLADGAGRTVYVLDAVPSDTNTWKPVNGNATPTSADSNVKSSLIGTTTNASGNRQATYNGKPLYYYAGDSAAGQKNGQAKRASGAMGRLVTPGGTATGGGMGTKRS